MNSLPSDPVRRGIHALDTLSPGWEQVVDPTVLNMSNADLCVLGQLDAHEQGIAVLDGNFFAYLTRHNLDFYWAVAHGFAVFPFGSIADEKVLRQEWKAAIERRTSTELVSTLA